MADDKEHRLHATARGHPVLATVLERWAEMAPPHAWYEAKFGKPLVPYASAEEAISTLPTTATAIGLRPAIGGQIEICAPFGVDDLLGLVVRANKKQISRSVYEANRALAPAVAAAA